MLKIRLTKVGSKNEKKFRIIVAPARSKRNGKFLENLGYFFPKVNNKKKQSPNLPGNEIKIDKQRYNFWIERGAQPSKAVLKLLESST